MQDIYAFDVGDFGKIGLLRHLIQSTQLTLGVLWWMTNAGTEGADGKHVGYLQDETFRTCDPVLWDDMGSRFTPEQRRVKDLESLFHPSTVFHDTYVPGQSRRAAWFTSAMAAVESTEVVFCDPDNGMLFSEGAASIRHISLCEIESLLHAGHSVVVYHHLNRSCTHDEQIARALSILETSLEGYAARIWAARFRRGSSRVFFVLAVQKHVEALGEAMASFATSPWCMGGHFSVVTSSGGDKAFKAPQTAVKVVAVPSGGPSTRNISEPRACGVHESVRPTMTPLPPLP